MYRKDGLEKMLQTKKTGILKKRYLFVFLLKNVVRLFTGCFALQRKKRQRIWVVFISVALLLSTLAQSYAVTGTTKQGTGLKEPTEQQMMWLEENSMDTKAVQLNSFGLNRMNSYLTQKGKPGYDSSLAVPLGQEPQPFPIVGDSQTGSIQELPDSIDNSQLPYFPPIRAQGSINACVAFASTYYQMTYMTAFARGWNVRDNTDNTRKFSPKWTYNFVNGGVDNGAGIADVYNILLKHGAATWDEFPLDNNYLQWCTNPNVWRNAINYRLESLGRIQDIDSEVGLNSLKKMLTNGYILTFATYIDSWQWSKIKDDPSTTKDNAYVGKSIATWENGMFNGHMMTIVGYNDNIWTDINNNNVIDSGEKGALRVANSWGSGWMEQGFTWLAYDALKSVSAVTDGPGESRQPIMWNKEAYWITAKPSYTPLLLGKFTMSHARRNQTFISLGYGDTTSDLPFQTWDSSAIFYQGGNFAFDGTKIPSEGTFYLDFTDLITENDLNNGSVWRWFLQAGDSSKDGVGLQLKNFTLVVGNSGQEIQSGNSFPLAVDGGLAYSYIDSSSNGIPQSNSTPLPTSTIFPTSVNTSKPTATPTNTLKPSNTPTATNTPVPTATSTLKPTNTPVPTATSTLKPTNTPVPTATSSPKPTNTPVPTATSTPKPTNTPVPTATSTPKPTNTPVPTDTPTPASTITPTTTAVSFYKITGYVEPDFIEDGLPVDKLRSGFAVEAVGADKTVISNVDGFFEISGIKKGTEISSIRVSKKHYLIREIKYLTVNGDIQLTSKALPIQMWAGDFELDGLKDNAINMSDIMVVSKYFNTTSGDGRYNPEIDINLDGVINLSDVMIVASHFNSTG